MFTFFKKKQKIKLLEYKIQKLNIKIKAIEDYLKIPSASVMPKDRN